jgi:hypothetical protein
MTERLGFSEISAKRRRNDIQELKSFYLKAKVQNLALTVLCVPYSLDSTRQSRPDFGFGFQVNALHTFRVVLSWPGKV